MGLESNRDCLLPGERTMAAAWGGERLWVSKVTDRRSGVGCLSFCCSRSSLPAHLLARCPFLRHTWALFCSPFSREGWEPAYHWHGGVRILEKPNWARCWVRGGIS